VSIGLPNPPVASGLIALKSGFLTTIPNFSVRSAGGWVEKLGCEARTRKRRGDPDRDVTTRQMMERVPGSPSW
jgi:hypothetical protein